jgi:beta-N-acetylhexosaminidase
VSDVVGTAAHATVAQQIADRTVTLVRNEGGLLPLTCGGGRSVLVTGWGTPTTTLADAFGRRGVSADPLDTGLDPTTAQIAGAVAGARSHDVVVVVGNRIANSAAQARLVAALQATGRPVVLIAVRDPYDIAYAPTVTACLATYGHTGASLEAVARVMFGEVNPTAHLPVTIPVADAPRTPLYPFGHGLSYP